MLYLIFLKQFNLSDGFFSQGIELSEDLNFFLRKIHGGEYNEQMSASESKEILFTIFGLSLGIHVLPISISAEDLIANTTTLLSVEHSLNGEVIKGCFLPEGPLNSVATYSLLKHTEHLLIVVRELKKYDLINIGHFGEMIAEFVLLHRS